MKQEYLGFDKNGYHDRHMTHVENAFLGVLWPDHVGPANRIGADDLAIRFDYAVDGFDFPEDKAFAVLTEYKTVLRWRLSKRMRHVRELQNHLLMHHDHLPILSRAGNGGGYWIAESEEEAEAFYETFRKRGMTGLFKASRGKKAALVDMMQQLTFEFDDMVDQMGPSGPIKPKAPAPTPIEVVDAFLEKMLKHPEKYADGLRKIGLKYGSVLLPKAQVAAMRAKAKELSEIVASIGV